jgi:hypothetical protein
MPRWLCISRTRTGTEQGMEPRCTYASIAGQLLSKWVENRRASRLLEGIGRAFMGSAVIAGTIALAGGYLTGAVVSENRTRRGRTRDVEHLANQHALRLRAEVDEHVATGRDREEAWAEIRRRDRRRTQLIAALHDWLARLETPESYFIEGVRRANARREDAPSREPLQDESLGALVRQLVQTAIREGDVLLAGLFELQLTRSAFDADPDVGRVPIARITHDEIEALAVRLGGDPETALFGAFRDAWADDDLPVPEYPSDETDEG